ncbi:MAG: HAD-IC family P-type ATPase [Patescibacteria group bacterium]
MFHAKTKEQTIKDLNTNAELGLTEKETTKCQKEFGKNKLSEAKPPQAIFIFLKQFSNFFTIILLVAAALSLILKEHFDFVVILAAVSFNLVIGFIQEFKAAKTIYGLKKMVFITAKVLREGRVHKILAEDLVPGDIIFVDAGDKVPADARLLESLDLHTREAILTGEATPSKKKADKIFPEKTPLADRENMIYMGTFCLSGKAKATVTACGPNSEMGKIASLALKTKEKQTPLETKMKSLSLEIAFLTFAAILLILFGGVIRGIALSEMFLTAIALAVAVIPEGLLVTVVIVLTLGMRRILERKALVRELLAAETLGSTTVICTDKTGTITSGEMRVEQILTADRVFNVKDFKNTKDPALMKIFQVGLLCNDVYVENDEGENENRWKFLGDPTETALFYAAGKADLKKRNFEKNYKLLDEIPFDSYLKYMAVAQKNLENGQIEFFVKGSCERILDFSSHFFEKSEIKEFTRFNQKEKFLELNSQLSQKAYRVLACGYKILGKIPKNLDMKKETTVGLVFLGLVAIRDPVRTSVKEAIKTCEEAGIRVKMITGDHKATAKVIGQEVGINAAENEILSGEDLDFLPPAELGSKICQAKIFARVAPKHKLQIVEALQEKKEIVAMTGDGVNDTPALKAANIGIAMGQGSEAARETSNMILLNNNFKTIEAAVEEGRIIFDNIRKVTLYLLLYTFAKVILIGGALLFNFALPLLPVQILWMNIIEDGLPDFALAFEKKEKGIMKEKPKNISEQILNPVSKIIIFLVGLPAAILLFAVYFYLVNKGFDENYLRSLVFITLALTSVITVYSCKSLRTSICHRSVFTNRFLNIAVITSIFLLILAIYLPGLQTILKTMPLGIFEWLFAFAFAALNILAIEIIKKIFNKPKIQMSNIK